MFAGWQNRKKFCPIPKFTNSYPINPTVLVIHIFYSRSLFWVKKFCIITWFIIVLRMGQKQAQNWWYWILPCNIFKINTTPNSNTNNEGSSSSNIKFHLSLHGTFKLLNSVSWIQEIELCNIKKLAICSIGFLEFSFLKISNMFDNFKKLYSRKHTL